MKNVDPWSYLVGVLTGVMFTVLAVVVVALR